LNGFFIRTGLYILIEIFDNALLTVSLTVSIVALTKRLVVVTNSIIALTKRLVDVTKSIVDLMKRLVVQIDISSLAVFALQNYKSCYVLSGIVKSIRTFATQL